VSADVVEILQYVCKNRRKQLERHRSWLPFARTQSARHKLQKFVHEQAALESCETVTGLTAPSTNGASQPSGEANSVATLDDLSQGWGAAEWPGARVSANKAGPPPSLAGRLGSNGAAAPAATEAGVGVELEVGSSDENAAVLTQQVESVWISLSCQNRTGILAEAAATIAAHGYNILVRSSIVSAFTAAQGVEFSVTAVQTVSVQCFGCSIWVLCIPWKDTVQVVVHAFHSARLIPTPSRTPVLLAQHQNFFERCLRQVALRGRVAANASCTSSSLECRWRGGVVRPPLRKLHSGMLRYVCTPKNLESTHLIGAPRSARGLPPVRWSRQSLGSVKTLSKAL
jgi:hypothetical protein